MATIIDLVTNDFEQVFPSILKNGKVELTVEDLLETSNSFILEELEYLKGMPSVSENERVSLKDFIILMDESEDPVDYDESINKRLYSYIQAHPGIKSFEFFQIRYRVTHYADGGLDHNTLVEYYKDIFEHQSILIMLHDFFERSEFLIPILLLEEPTKELVSIFQFAIDKYPEKALLKFTLGRLYDMRNEVEKALDWSLKFIGQVEANRIHDAAKDTYEYIGDYTIEDYHISLSSIARLFYENSELENAYNYSDICMKEYHKSSNDIYSFQFLFLDPMLIKLRTHIRMGNKVDFEKDYELLRSTMDDIDFEELDIDDIKEFAKELKM